MIILIEGPRNSGKTFLINSLEGTSTFKFPFPDWFEKLKLDDQSRETHSFALAKEIMLHQLNRDLFIDGSVFVDRGIITTWVWGVMQGRITLEEAKEQIDLWHEENLFRMTSLVIVNGDNPEEREEKDAWDDTEKKKEKYIYTEVLSHVAKTGVSVHNFSNLFDLESVVRFKLFLIKAKADAQL